MVVVGVVALPSPHTAHQPRVYSTICSAELGVALLSSGRDVLPGNTKTCRFYDSAYLPPAEPCSRNFYNSDRKTSQIPGRVQIQTERK